MNKLKTIILAAGYLFLAPSLAQAGDHPELQGLLDKGPQALLERTDQKHNAFEDQTIRIAMTIEGGTNDGTTIETTTHTKGKNRRAIRMHAPANLKGMGVVVKSRDEIYVRLPDSRKVRRVGSHAKRQTFMGTTWNFDDMSMIWLAPDYTAKVESKTDSHIVLKLTLKEGIDLQYTTVTAYVVRENLLIDQMKYFNDAGEHVKTQTRSDLKVSDAGISTFHNVVMKDEKSKVVTRTKVLSEKVNSGLKDKMFGRRWLSRGP
jgi:hypothetical protein